VLNEIAGKDAFDSTIVSTKIPDFTSELNKSISGLRIGIAKEYFGDGLAPEVRERAQYAINKLESLGAKITEVSLPHSEYVVATYYIVMPSEASSNLSRYDGIRYGHSSKDAKDLLDVYLKSRAKGFGPEPRRRIILGTYALSAGYYDAYYLKAQKVRALIKKDFDDAFKTVDVIVGPTAPTTAFKIGEKSSDPLSMYLADIYTCGINLAGLPAISIPCGRGKEANMPVGFQIIGKHFDEQKAF
jgi:aspartyl-tRNA(Asn)/glutamyl-tRNA(Gln) amidotransferase subunit A